uniref:Uncharacterized protein n=1 Tax=Arundo donax TaxID=35708 RepID=A0A0A8YHD3_ARUDO
MPRLTKGDTFFWFSLDNTLQKEENRPALCIQTYRSSSFMSYPHILSSSTFGVDV